MYDQGVFTPAGDQRAGTRLQWRERVGAHDWPPHGLLGLTPAGSSDPAEVRAESKNSVSWILAVERKSVADVIGYCGLIFPGDASPDEPELVYELLRGAHGCGYATEASRAVVTPPSEAGYRRLRPRSGTGMSRRGPGEARVPRNGPGGARLLLRPQPADRTRVLTGADSGSVYARHHGSRQRPPLRRIAIPFNTLFCRVPGVRERGGRLRTAR
jgi:hypothetical protein